MGKKIFTFILIELHFAFTYGLLSSKIINNSILSINCDFNFWYLSKQNVISSFLHNASNKKRTLVFMSQLSLK